MTCYRNLIYPNVFLLVFFFFQTQVFGHEKKITISEIDSLNKLAYSKLINNPDSARFIANQTLSYSEKLNYQKGTGHALNYIGISYHNEGSYDSAKLYYDKSLHVFEEENDTVNTIQLLNNLTLLFCDQNYYHIALSYNFRFLKIALNTGNVNDIFNSYSNIGENYEKLEEYNNALEFHKKALESIITSENYLNNKFYYVALANIGRNSLYLKKYKTVEENSKIAFNYFLQTKDIYNLSNSANNLGAIYLQLKDYQEAEKYIKIAIETALQISNSLLLANAKMTLGKYYFEQQQFANAELKFKEVQVLAKTNEFFKIEAETYAYLSKIDSENGRFLEAIKNMEQSNTIVDNLNSNTVERLMNEQNFLYGLNKKDNEINLLKEEKYIQEVQLTESISQLNSLYILIASCLLILIVSLYYQIRFRKINHILNLKNDKLKAAKKKMEKMVKKKTAELIKNQEILETKSRMLAIASHEIKTPLTAMKLNLSSLSRYWDQLEDTTKKNKLFKLDDAISQFDDISFDFLLSNNDKIDQLDCKPEILNFDKLMNPIIENVQEATNYSHDIEVQHSKNDSFIYIDKKLSVNIFKNLLKNAVKFSPEGKKVIIKTTVSETCFRVDFIDFGIGVNEEDQTRIFSPFERGSNTQNIEGTGLGLNIVKSLVELHHGKIKVSSKMYEGSTFSVWFPRKPNPWLNGTLNPMGRKDLNYC